MCCPKTDQSGSKKGRSGRFRNGADFHKIKVAKAIPIRVGGVGQTGRGAGSKESQGNIACARGVDPADRENIGVIAVVLTGIKVTRYASRISGAYI